MEARSKRIQPLSLDLGEFVFLDRLKFNLTGTGLWWNVQDIDAGNVVAAALYGYTEDSDTSIAYLIVADVTGDRSEPQIANLSLDELSEIDKYLESGTREFCDSNGIILLNWHGSSWRNAIDGRQLLSGYTVDDPDIGPQYRAVARFQWGGKKYLVESAFQLASATQIETPMIKAISSIRPAFY